MYKVAVIGDLNSVYGFAALGLETFPVSNSEEAIQKLKSIVLSKYAVVYITESLCEEIKEEIEIYSKERIPAIIPIPGVVGNNSLGINNLKRYVEQAVGSDIIFGES